MKLIIVESPAKARTIAKFLGPEYKVAASYGHIRDLPGSAKEIPERYRNQAWARLGVDTENDFQPVYVISSESKGRVTELKKLLKQADELLLATDEDREGEAISWHLLEVLEPRVPVKRITFHEITRTAIERALTQPREVDRQLVRAQESRRILDRLFGYSLSPVLWKKVRTKLSAGRVQSVAVRLIVEREEERQAFRAAEYWDVEASLAAADQTFNARLVSVGGQKLAEGKDFDAATGKLRTGSKRLSLDQAAAERIAAGALVEQPWRVGKVEHKQTRQRPGPPFITSTLQQAASGRLGLSPQRTMIIAQRLYEGVDLGGGARDGLITYMRTDSVTLSEKALGEAASFIRQEFGDRYSSGPRRYKTKSKAAQEAHEAIRPTDILRTPESVAPYLEKEELALYRLIWSRTVASQMADAELDKASTDLEVELDASVHVFRATGSVVRFDGFLRAYNGKQRDTWLPDLKEGQAIGGEQGAEVRIDAVTPRGHETSPPARYTEASLIKKLEEEGIGRPSTYAPVISTIQARDYVVKKSGALLPSYIGLVVTRLLRYHFARYVDLKFTAAMEGDLDRIATGEIDWRDFLSTFYHGSEDGQEGLLARIEQELPGINYPAIALGNDPRTGEPVTLRIGRTFVYVQLGEGGDNKRATLPVDLLIDELDLEKALELIEARGQAREPLGQDPASGQNIYVLSGPFGPYVQLGETNDGEKPKRVSLSKGRRPEDVDLEHALRLLSLPRSLGNDPETGQEVTAGVGRYGPYVQRARVFASLDDDEKLFSISLDEALELIRNKNKKTILKELGPHPESGEQLQVIAGRYGPYVTDGQVNATLGKQDDPTAITVAEAVALLMEAAQRKGRRKKVSKKVSKKRTGKKKASKKAATKKPATKKKTPKKTSTAKEPTQKKAASNNDH